MKRTIKIEQPTPKERVVSQAILPMGMYCNVALQNAKIGDAVQFQCGWRKDKRVITNMCRFRISSPEFTFMLRSIYGGNMTIGGLMERWEAWAVVEGIGAAGFSREEALVVEVVEENSEDSEFSE